MSFSSGTFSINSTGQPVVTGTVISSTVFNAFTADIATGLSTCILKDGTQTLTANIPMGSFKLTGLASGSARTDSINLGQVQDSSFTYVSTVGGTADVITLTPSPAITAYAAGQRFAFLSSGANTTNVTINVSGLGAKALTKDYNAALVANDIAGANRLIVAEYDGTEFQLKDYIAAGTSGHRVGFLDGTNTISGAHTFSIAPILSGSPLIQDLITGICEGRITLTSGTAVTTADVTAATTVYFTPYKGNRIALYDGSAHWKLYSFSELSIAVPATTSTMYDLWCYDNSGTPTLEALAWTNDTTRATALALQNGVYVKSGATTRRYLGSFRTTAVSGQTEDSLAKRYVWNYYNRAIRPMRVREGTDTWTYTTAAFQQANASAANQLDFIIGVSENVVTADVLSMARNGSGNVVWVVAIGLDSTTTMDTACINQNGESAAANVLVPTSAYWNGYPGVGRHYLAWLEYSAATGTTTWIGDGGTTYLQAGISGELLG